VSVPDILRWLLWRDVQLVLRQHADVLSMLFFFVITTSLFPLAVGADPKMLHTIGPGVVWVAALLSTMLSLGRLFHADYQDGSLEQLLLSPVPLTMAVAVKIFAYWLTTGLPLVFLAPVLGMMFGMADQELWVMTWSLLLGTPVLNLIGAVGAALTLGVRGGSVLLAVLILPLYVPVLIFGAGSVVAVAGGQSAQGGISLLAALLVLTVVFAPVAVAACLRIALE